MVFTHPITGKQVPDYLAGVIAPMFTPVDSEGQIDHNGLREYTHYLNQSPSITTLFWRSGVGRMFTFNKEEFKESLKIVMQTVEGNKPVFAGTNGIHDGNFNNKADYKRYMNETLELTYFAKEQGASAVVLVVPAALPVEEYTPEEITASFFAMVHENIDIPILIYNPQSIPPAFRLKPILISYLSNFERIIGLKLSTNDMYWMALLINAAADNEFFTIAGSECTFYQAILTGAVGVIGQGCSIYPHILKRILDEITVGQIEQARMAQFDVNKALEGFQNLPPDISGFAFLRKKGLLVSEYCRDGTNPLSLDEVDGIYNAIEPICAKYL